jgi:superfamily II RNA helicase
MALFESFEAWATRNGISLYPHQEDAMLEVFSGSNLVLTTPTGSGKSMVAIAAHYAAMATGVRSFYTAPIKALVSEKFFALIDVFGAENVGMMTGDAQVNADAPIVCCTAEVLANLALREGSESSVRQVIMDEFHFYADSERGWAWQVPLIELDRAQFVLMSATLGDVTFFTDELERRTGRPTAVVTSVERPVPLTFSYVLTPVHETIETLLAERKAPIYIVHSTRAAAIDRAQSMMSMNVCTKEEKEVIKEAIGHFAFRSSFGKTLSRFLKHGIGVHHAGMLPKYRRLTEQLAQSGLLKVICGTDTLGVGINLPIRAVLLTALTKFDGRRSRVMKAREFHQIVGRAGRAGYDVAGYVVAQAPEHVIENAKAAEKSANSGNKRSKPMVKKPPDGFVNWSDHTFAKLQESQPETLTSHFRVTHSMMLNVIAREGDAFSAMRHLLSSNHDDRTRQRMHIRRAIAIYRALLAAEVIERLSQPDAAGRTVRLTIDLQTNFALNQPLSMFALAAFDLLDEAEPTYSLDMLSVIEATLEDPRQVLMAQESKAKGEAIAFMKADGVLYEERMEQLNSISWPKPLQELLTHAYLAYSASHPWVLDHELAPKSIARDMYERAMTFNEFIAFYALSRSEGLVLRYLADAYKALRQTVPSDMKTDELRDLEEWLGEVVRQTDSSLLDEWEQLRNPETVLEATRTVADDGPPKISSNDRAFRVLVRNAMFRRVELAARRQYGELGELDGVAGWTGQRWHDAMDGYFDEYAEIGTGPSARGPHLLVIDTSLDRKWVVRQILEDPESNGDWSFVAEVDLDESDEQGNAVVRLQHVGPS